MIFHKNKHRFYKNHFGGSFYFTTTWEQRKLGEIGEFKSNGVDKLSKPNEINVNLLNYMDVYNRRKITNKNVSYLMQVTAKPNQIKDNNVLKGDVFFTPTSETADDIGHVMVIEETLENTVYSYHLMRYRPNQNIFYLTFPNYGLDTTFVRKQMELSAQGVQRFVINRRQFEDLEMRLPTIAEQKKISITLTKLDNLITLHQRKYEKFVNVKKAMLEKMFPQGSDKTPKIRFKGFTDPWEQRKLGEIVDYVVDNRGKNPDYYCDDGIPVIDNFMIGELYPDLKIANRFIDDNLFENFIRKYNNTDDILITLVGNGIGKMSLFPNKKAVIIQNTLGFRCEHNDKKFCYYELLSKNKEIISLDRGMAQPSIRQDELLDITFYTTNLKEEKKISTILYQLDNLITLHQRECEKLKNIKKACLEKMFV